MAPSLICRLIELNCLVTQSPCYDLNYSQPRYISLFVSYIEMYAGENSFGFSSIGEAEYIYGLEYTIANRAVTITGYKGKSKSLKLPAEIDKSSARYSWVISASRRSFFILSPNVIVLILLMFTGPVCNSIIKQTNELSTSR